VLVNAALRIWLAVTAALREGGIDLADSVRASVSVDRAGVGGRAVARVNAIARDRGGAVVRNRLDDGVDAVP
jgi:hypothetical protein